MDSFLAKTIDDKQAKQPYNVLYSKAKRVVGLINVTVLLFNTTLRNKSQISVYNVNENS